MSREYEETVKIFSEMIYKIALTGTGNVWDAEDVTQNTFVKLLKCKKDFTDDEHKKAWLIKVAVNEIRQLRRSAWFRKREAEEIPEITDGTDLNSAAENRIVYDAVMQLKQDYRIAVILHYYYDYPCDRIAVLTNTKEATVRTRLKRAREQLKTILKEDLYDE